MLTGETNSSDLEEAWASFGVKLKEFCGQLSSTEVRVFEAIVRAAADEAEASDETVRLPPNLTENTQPQRDGISLLLADAIAHFRVSGGGVWEIEGTGAGDVTDDGAACPSGQLAAG
jgi:hypothetical protein